MMATSNSWHRAGTRVSGANWAAVGAESAGIAGKRAFDVALSIAGLVVGLPVLALCAAAVSLESRGPVMSRTKCWGRGARSFARLRLRTCDDAGRMTRTGRVLRRLGIDGLPQLVNVLRGEMSIVGPAPVPAGDRDEASVRHLRRFEVQPGMTGMWGLGSCLENAPMGYFSPEGYYRSNWSAWLDLAIVARALGLPTHAR